MGCFPSVLFESDDGCLKSPTSDAFIVDAAIKIDDTFTFEVADSLLLLTKKIDDSFNIGSSTSSFGLKDRYNLDKLNRSQMVEGYSDVGGKVIHMTDSPAHTNALLMAVHLAYAHHKRLVLEPDHIYLPLLEAAAIHVMKDPQKCRQFFTDNAAQDCITVSRDDFGPPHRGVNKNNWMDTLTDFKTALRSRVKGGDDTLLIPSFSTTTSESRLAFISSTMNPMSEYFR